jgi:hypothetical protein
MIGRWVEGALSEVFHVYLHRLYDHYTTSGGIVKDFFGGLDATGCRTRSLT